MTTNRDVMVTALFTIGAQGFAVVIASRSRTANERGLGLVPAEPLCERLGRGLIARCGHPVDSAVAQIANCALIRELLRACRPQLDHGTYDGTR